MLLYQLDARIWLGEESNRERRPVTLGSISASSLDRIADRGFRWLWLRGVWEVEPPRGCTEATRRGIEDPAGAARRRAADIDARGLLEEHRVRQRWRGRCAESREAARAPRYSLSSTSDPPPPGRRNFRELEGRDDTQVDGVPPTQNSEHRGPARSSVAPAPLISDGGDASTLAVSTTRSITSLARTCGDAAAVSASSSEPSGPAIGSSAFSVTAGHAPRGVPATGLFCGGDRRVRRARGEARPRRPLRGAALRTTCERAARVRALDGEAEAFLDRLLEIVDWPRWKATRPSCPVREARDGNATSQQPSRCSCAARQARRGFSR
jgi:hypothetical protein